MAGKTVGIDDMSLYIPEKTISLQTIQEHRATQDPSGERRFKRAIESTGQKAIRFPEPWEDSVTFTAEAVRRLVDQGMSPEGIRYFASGTETSVDMSKPISAYTEGLLQRGGIAVPETLSTFQVQHACAGGTVALMSVAALLKAAGRTGESGVVVSSDVARYETPSTAEITQGAGAVALHVTEEPSLLELDLDSIGLASRDEEDFFRPLGSITARVQGRYSVECYNRALSEAFTNHAERLGKSTKDALMETDIFVLHVPFYKMALMGLSHLAHHACECTAGEVKKFIAQRGFSEGLEATRYIGNIYSGSLYMAMMFSLTERLDRFGDDLVGKTVTLASYGSGNTMATLRGTVSSGAPEKIRNWNLDKLMEKTQQASIEEYERFVEKRTYDLSWGETDISTLPSDRFYLKGIREDGYREYALAE